MIILVFSDLLFIFLFFPVCLGLYHLIGSNVWKNSILIIFSLLFYAFGEPVWVVLLILSSLADYFNGLFIEKHRGEKIAVMGVAASLVFNLGVLALFKYSGFFLSGINALAGLHLPVPEFAPPVGISFYTFQTITYTVDVYRGKAPVQKNFFNFLLYVSMFFQLVAGPIVRYTDVADSLSLRKVTASDISEGFSRFSFGLGKKVLIANCVGEAASSFLDFETLPDSSLAAWSGVILYTLQIYYDFSGYSDMAIGLGKMFGFSLPENFDYPYISRSVTEFWRRWHMTMGGFFRDYVYIPMGGNRKHQAVNLAVVWLLTGLWHGASINFVIWGAYFGILVTLEKFFFKNTRIKIPAVISHIYLMAAVMFGWIIFYYEDLSKAGACLKGMFGKGVPLYDEVTAGSLMGICFIIAIAVIFCCPFGSKMQRSKKQDEGIPNSTDKKILPFASTLLASGKIIAVLGVFLLSCLMLVKQSYNPFLYFRF